MKTVKLFCLPYAGGSALVYTKWKKLLGNGIDIYPVELAGRGKRFEMPLYGCFNEAVEDVYNAVKNDVSESAYAFWGHSMGSLLAFELTYKLVDSGYGEPVHLFLSGRRPPHLNDNDRKLYDLPDNEFIKEIRKLGGTPDDFFKNDELLKVYIPVLKADFKIIEKYKLIKKRHKLNTSITLLCGTKDTINPTEANEWRNYTRGQFRVVWFEGGHFFINDYEKSIADIINTTLNSSLPV